MFYLGEISLTWLPNIDSLQDSYKVNILYFCIRTLYDISTS